MVTQDLHISKRLKKLLPSLTKEERTQLEANIVADGRVTDTVLYWFDGNENKVADGMHRFEIARRLGIPYKTEPIEIGDTYEDVELWILNRQLGRRNLISPQAQRKLRGELYNRLKRKAGDGRSPEGHFVPMVEGGPLPPAETVAEAAGVDPKTVKRDGAYVEALKKCSSSIQKGENSGAFKLSPADVQTLAKLNEVNQDNIANDLRKGQAKTVKEAMEKRKIKTPGPSKCSADFIAAVDSGRVRITKEQIKVLSGIPAKKRREAEVAMMAGKSPAHTINPYRRAIKTLTPAEKKAMEARDQIKIWYDTIGRWLGKSVSIDEIREQFPGTQGDHVVKQATQFFESLKKWEKVIK